MTLSLLETTLSDTRTPIPNKPQDTLVAALKTALTQALQGDTRLDPEVFAIPGMSGRKYRILINALVGALDDPRYLEIGSWAGSTLCSAINQNAVLATAIDNWSQFDGPKDQFSANLLRFQTPRAYVNFIEKDFRAVDFHAIGPFNIYMFDGPHEREDHFDGLSMALPALDPTFVLIVDDWNWQQVRDGTEEAMRRCRLETHYKLELRTTLDDSHPTPANGDSDWHNGYMLAILSQPS